MSDRFPVPPLSAATRSCQRVPRMVAFIRERGNDAFHAGANRARRPGYFAGMGSPRPGTHRLILGTAISNAREVVASSHVNHTRLCSLTRSQVAFRLIHRENCPSPAPSPPRKQTGARQNETGKAGPCNGAWNCANGRDGEGSDGKRDEIRTERKDATHSGISASGQAEEEDGAHIIPRGVPIPIPDTDKTHASSIKQLWICWVK